MAGVAAQAAPTLQACVRAAGELARGSPARGCRCFRAASCAGWAVGVRGRRCGGVRGDRGVGGGAGEYLESSADSTCTWLSSDGGQSWIDVLPTAAIYEVRAPAAAAACAAPHALAVASRSCPTHLVPLEPFNGERLALIAAHMGWAPLAGTRGSSGEGVGIGGSGAGQS